MAKRFRDKDHIALMQLIPTVAKLNDIEKPEAVSLSKLHNTTQRIRCHFDYKHGNTVKDSNRSNQHSKFATIDIDLQQGQSVERKGVNSIRYISSHLVNHIVDARVGVRVSVMPLRITLDQQMQGIGIRSDKRFSLCSNTDIDHGGKVDCGQAAESIAFCRCVHG